MGKSLEHSLRSHCKSAMAGMAMLLASALFGSSPAFAFSSAAEMLGASLNMPVAPSSAEILTLHNRERLAAGVSKLVWDESLAQAASQYADVLARLGSLRHSSRESRDGQGENLWMGTRGFFSPATMVGTWASERSMFRPARFPDVSTTGNWAQVGHYTQMIWPGTQRVGCAIGQGPRNEVLVCRYFPAGNVMGSIVP